MMKVFWTLGIISLIAYNSNNEKKSTESVLTFSLEGQSSVTEKAKFDLNGIWGLTNYFDSIIANKELAKYRLQPPTWFGILLQIKNDSLISFGSLIETNQTINLNSDTLTYFDSYGGKWNLIRQENHLLLKQFPNQTNGDSTIYTYRKRKDLDFMTQNMNKIHKIGDNVTTYFNTSLLSGKYKSSAQGKIIEFHEDGSLIGLDGYDKYEIRNYFGTLHPYGNLDVITFFESKTNKYKEYNWKFKDEVLILTELVNETIVYDGETIVTDNFTLGVEGFKLSRIYKGNHGKK